MENFTLELLHIPDTASNVRMLLADTKASGQGATVTVNDVSGGAKRAFFLIRDGADVATGFGNTLSFDSFRAPVGEIDLYHSLGKGFTPDAIEHVLSGVTDDGSSMRVASRTLSIAVTSTIGTSSSP